MTELFQAMGQMDNMTIGLWITSLMLVLVILGLRVAFAAAVAGFARRRPCETEPHRAHPLSPLCGPAAAAPPPLAMVRPAVAPCLYPPLATSPHGRHSELALPAPAQVHSTGLPTRATPPAPPRSAKEPMRCSRRSRFSLPRRQIPRWPWGPTRTRTRTGLRVETTGFRWWTRRGW